MPFLDRIKSRRPLPPAATHPSNEAECAERLLTDSFGRAGLTSGAAGAPPTVIRELSAMSPPHDEIATLRQELTRLKRELQASAQEVVAAHGRLHISQETTSALQAEFAEFKAQTQGKLTTLDKLRETVTALESQGAAATEEAARLQARAEDLQTSLDVAEKSLLMREKHDKRIRYVLADGHTGTIPADLFDSIPGSALAVLYAGEYQPPQDESGRVAIDCDHEIWRQTTGFARSGAIPEGPQPELLAQARLWNIEPLVEALEARVPGIADFQHHGDGVGFTARLNFTGLQDDVKDRRLQFVVPGGEAWGILVVKKGIYCYAAKGVNDYEPRNQQLTMRLLFKDETVERSLRYNFATENSDQGWEWIGWGYSYDEAISASAARSQGCLVVELQMNKGDRSPNELK